MYVAVMQVELELPGATTLKERRNLLNSLKNRVQNRFKVSVAEVGPVSQYTAGTLGVALVTSDPRLARERAEKILRYMENAPDTRVTDHQTEVI